MLPSEEIKDKINIVDLIGERVQLKKAGVNYRGLCPFHQEKTPSFMASPSKQIWHCFGCSLGGDMFEFVKLTEGVEFPEALEILAARAGITLRKPSGDIQYQTDQKKNLYDINNWAALFYAKVLSDSSGASEARNYLARRGLKSETIRTWQLGYAPEDYHAFENFISKKGYTKKEAVAAGLLIEKDGQFFDRFRGRIMFPLFDLHGRVVGFTARLLESSRPELVEGPVYAKYVNSPETLVYNKSRLIYGLHLAKTEIRKHDQVVIVEGNIDVITCHEAAPAGGQAGYGNVVGSSGTALTEIQLETLKRFTSNLYFAFDADEAGLLATRRAVELALSLGFNVKIVALPKALAKDPDELIRQDKSLWEERVANAPNFLDFYFELVFAKIDLQSNIGKKQAVAELLPLLSLLPDSIDRSHYAQKLALKIGIDEKIVIDLLNKLLTAKSKSRSAPGGSSDPAKPAPRKTKQELLEARVLGLFLKFAKNLAADWQNLQEQDFTTDRFREIYRLAAPAAVTGQFEITHFATEHPKVAADIELLTFAVENEISFAGDLSLDDLKKNVLAALRFESLKRRMQELTSRIKLAEQIGRSEEVKTLSLEFNNLTQELRKYHISYG